MAIPRPPRRLSLAQQAIRLWSCFPEAKITLQPTKLTWIGVIRPTPCSRDYPTKITYQYGWYPEVVTIDTLKSRPGENLPHTYSDGSLCLHEAHEWTPAMAIVDTVVPWTAEWLAHYELWRVRGRWYGDDLPARTAAPVPLPTRDIHNRAGRRREHRDPANGSHSAQSVRNAPQDHDRG
jgi:hypothetical protein